MTRQFHVYRNRNRSTLRTWPLLLNLQTDLMSETGTRVVVPLVRADEGMPMQEMRTLMPTFDIEGRIHVAMFPMLAAVRVTDMGNAVADLSGERVTLLAALDFLTPGI